MRADSIDDEHAYNPGTAAGVLAVNRDSFLFIGLQDSFQNFTINTLRECAQHLSSCYGNRVLGCLIRVYFVSLRFIPRYTIDIHKSGLHNHVTVRNACRPGMGAGLLAVLIVYFRYV